jgi:polyisoprenoid-binding protein YceI
MRNGLPIFSTVNVRGSLCGNQPAPSRGPRCGAHDLAAAAAMTLVFVAGLAQGADTAMPPATARVAPPPAGQYHLDKSHASLVLRVSHFGFSTYTTRFSRYESELTFDPNNLAASKVVTTIDAASLATDAWPTKCIEILNGPQLLDTAKYPQIVFKSGKIQMTGAKTMKISGSLTLHGVTKPVVLTASFNGGYAGMANMDPNARIGFSAHGAFKRSDFGMGFGIPAAGSKVGVGDLIDFSIETEFVGPPLPAAAAPSK